MSNVLLQSGLILFAAVCAIFIILFTTISMALKQASFFKGKISTIIALCASLLSVIGMLRFFGASDGIHAVQGENSRVNTNLDIILLPYAALGIAILLLLLIAFLLKISRKRKVEKYHQEFCRCEEKRYHFARKNEHVKKSDEKDSIRK